VFEETKVYDKYVEAGGDICQDIGVYMSTESKFYMTDKAITDPGVSTNATHEYMPQIDNALNFAGALIENNIPFGVFTKENLDLLDNFKVVVLPDVICMSEEEADAFRKYVKNGGRLYASKYTSLYRPDASIKDNDFMLADVLGINYTGKKTKEKITYAAPVGKGKKLFANYSKKYPVCIPGEQILIEADKNAEILATVSLPYTDPADASIFTSIHNNPPGKYLDNPSIVVNKYGKGKTVYVAGDLEKHEHLKDDLISLLGELYDGDYTFQSNAPKQLEIVCFHQKDNNRYLVNMLNFQKVVPSVPVKDFKIKVNLPEVKVKSVTAIPDEKEVKFKADKGSIEFTVDEVKEFRMFAVNY
jgi:hypothetical protein